MRLALAIVFLVALGSCTRRLPTTPFTHVYLEDFNRANQVLSSTARWNVETPSASVFNIVDEMGLPARGTGAEPNALYYQSVTPTDTKATVKIYVLAGTLANPNMKILARYNATTSSASTNGYQCGVDEDNYISIKRNGVTMVTGTTFFAFAPNDVYSLAFTQLGQGIFCSLEQVDGDSDSVGFHDPDTWDDGFYFGLSGGENGGNYGYFDDFNVYAR